MDVTAAQIAPLAAAPGLMVVASLCERRWGAQAAGLVAAAPVTVLVGVVMVSADLGAEAGRDLALSTSAHVLSQVALALVFFHAATRMGTAGGLVAATGTYAATAWATTFISTPVAVALGVVAVVVGRSLLGRQEPDITEAGTASLAEPVSGALVLAVRAVVALAAATGIFVAAHVFGPSVGGAVGAYPVFSVTLACLVASGTGLSGLRNVLRGLVRALPAYLAFGVTYWLSAPALGGFVGIGAATLVCCLVYLVINRPARTGRATPLGLVRVEERTVV